MKKSRIITKRKVIMAILVTAIMMGLIACAKSVSDEGVSSKGDKQYSSNKSESTYNSLADSKSSDTPYSGEMNESVSYDMMEESGLASISTVKSNVLNEQSQEKIVRRIEMNVETLKYEELLDVIDEEINILGGYVESSQIYGSSLNYNRGARDAEIIARIPKTKLDSFVKIVKDNANVVNKYETTENVTLNYVDTESRKKSLEIQQERLFDLMEKTALLEDIIALERRLDDIRYELQSYESQLRLYDNLVEYSTITIHISEVKVITPIVDDQQEQSVWTEMKDEFVYSLHNIVNSMQTFSVGFVGFLPYLLIWAMVILLFILIFRMFYRSVKNQKIENKESGYDSSQVSRSKEEITRQDKQTSTNGKDNGEQHK